MRIVTDSAADLTANEIEELDIHVVSLRIKFPDGEVSSEEISRDEFYTRLKRMEPEIPTTSQPSAGQFEQIYRTISQSGEEILSVHISTGLSGTLEAARLGASHVKDAHVTLWDSFTLSGAERFQVLAAANAARMGWDMPRILERLKALREHSETAFTLETMEYLRRGGRIGRVQALAGALLKIKPIILVDKTDGKYSSGGRARTLAKAMEMILERNREIFGQETRLWVSVMHGQLQDQAETLKEMVQDRLNVAHLEILRISPVLGVHTGPGVVGIAVTPAELMEDFK